MSIRRKQTNDVISHKVIEKRRRDRINNCLAELTQTVPTAFIKHTTGKLEKAEILEMTVEYLRFIKNFWDSMDFNKATTSGMSYEEGFSSFTYNRRPYVSGYNDCISDLSRYLTDIEGLPINHSRCVKTLTYLQSKIYCLTSGNTFHDNFRQQSSCIDSSNG